MICFFFCKSRLAPGYFGLIALIFISAASVSVRAQVTHSAVSSAAGGTGRGSVEPGDAIYLNPATLVHLRGRYLYSSYTEGSFAASISDNTQESSFPSGLSYIKTYVPDSTLLTEQNIFSLSLAEFAYKKWAMGITGSFFQHKLGDMISQQTNADIGFIYTPTENMGLGLVIYDVFGEHSDIPEVFKRKTKVAAGFNYIYQNVVRMRVDITSKTEAMAGIETYINSFIITRLGYYSDQDDDRSFVTAGAGFRGPKFHINYAYEGNPQNSGDYRHSVDLAIPF
jgi:hypothetical protein